MMVRLQEDAPEVDPEGGRETLNNITSVTELVQLRTFIFVLRKLLA